MSTESEKGVPRLRKKEKVFEILDKNRGMPLSEDGFISLQREIEDLTMKFDDESILKTVPSLMKILIRGDLECAKDYLRKRLLEKEDMELLSEFGHYTIEALIIHVLSMVFNTCEFHSVIRVASLVERLESSVRIQGTLLKCRRCKIPFSMSKVLDESSQLNKSVDTKNRSKLSKMYPFGSSLVEFMEERELITLFSDLSGTVRVKKGAYYLPSNLYAICNFDLSLLPIKLNLPMVCKPLDWRSAIPGQNPRTLSDLSGGYLSGPTGEIYDRYRLLTSHDNKNFYIDISGEERNMNLCRIMNKLQGQSFKINSNWLNILQEYENQFVENGYLMPRFLSSLNVKGASYLLREFYLKDEVIKTLCSFSELLQTLYKNIQRSRYENFIIKLAIAYNGYTFYLPAFLDFRGRIYRCGSLHFHERDLARSLIVFSDSNSSDFQFMSQNDRDKFIAATAFHYKSFVSVKESVDFLKQNKNDIKNDPFGYISKAKHPFQFFSHLPSLFDLNIDAGIPITQDASASAYQIMSYFLLNETLAKRTNLIPSEDGKIQDVYSFLLEELKEFMKDEMDKNLSTIVCDHLTRKLVKGIFMPIIYGKTLMSTASDIKEHLSHFLTHKECFEVASACFQFWRKRYSDMECLIRLIRHIGWISSSRDRPVFYKVPYFSTVQDYTKTEAIKIWVYDRLQKRRHGVTLRVSTSKRDRRKTEISTFVNFIHQRDAYIAMSVVEEMLSMNAPIYTVHDNFITTTKYSDLIPKIYSNVICSMGPPLSIINEFIYMNVIKHILKRELVGPPKNDFSNRIIPRETLDYFLKANIPEHISKKEKATWEERISGILTSYETYTRYVCGGLKSPRVNWLSHEDKWNNFQLKLKVRGFPNYCVHY